MTDLLGTGLGIADVSAGGVLLGVIIAVLTGRLIPKSQHEAALRAKDEVIASVTKDRDHWRDAYDAESAANVVTTAQVDKLVEQGRTFTHLFDSLRTIAAQHTPGGGTT